MARPLFDQASYAAVHDVLSSGVLAQGPQIAQLEQDVRRSFTVEHALAVSSGTSALQLIGAAMDLAHDALVLVPGLTFAATANAFLSAGCRVRPIDIDPATGNLAPDALADALDSEPAVDAVVFVDLFGNSAGGSECITVAQARGIPTIEDAAQAHGARDQEGRSVAARATAAAFSLYATKNIAAGEGGLVTTSDKEIADRIRLLRSHGSLAQYEHVITGVNHRLNEMAAALARTQLPHLDAWNVRRHANAEVLSAALSNRFGDAVTLPTIGSPAQHVLHQYTCTFADPMTRDHVAEWLDRSGIDTKVFYPYTIAQLPGVEPNALPNAEHLRDHGLSLPVHPGLTSIELERLDAAIQAVPAPR